MNDELVRLLRAALSEAVRTGRAEVARELTRLVISEVQRVHIVDTRGEGNTVHWLPLPTVKRVRVSSG
jgi:hypothetical protein